MTRLQSKTSIAVIAGIVLLAGFLLPLAHASAEEKQVKIIAPDTNITIPGLEFTDPKRIQQDAKTIEGADTRGVIQIPYLGEYLAAIYRYAVAIAVIIAIVMVIVGGFQWAFSGGSQEAIASAKKRIANAITGLILAAGSYLILFTINPDLVRFRSLTLTYIEGRPIDISDAVFDAPLDDTANAINYAALPPNISPIVDGPGLVVTRKKQHGALPEAAQALQSAAKEYNDSTGGTILVNDSFRSPDEQYDIMVSKCKCDPVNQLPNDVAPTQWGGICKVTANACGVANYTIIKRVSGAFQTKPISHLGGFSFDIQTLTTRSYKLCDAADENEKLSQGVAHVSGRGIGSSHCIPKEQQQLIKVMIKHGFCVGLRGNGLREPWHFEHRASATAAGVNTSTFCTDSLSDPNLQKLYYLQN